MDTLHFRKWELAFDAEATRRGYEEVQMGAESCPEDVCQNFAAARSEVYPPEALALLGTLGVDYQREAETFWTCKVTSARAKFWRDHGEQVPDSVIGLQLYGGWFHTIGNMKSGPDSHRPLGRGGWAIDLEPLTDRFSIGFSSASPSLVPPSFKGRPIVQVDFQAHAPWIIEKPEPAD